MVLAKSRQISNIDGRRIVDMPSAGQMQHFLKEERDVCRKNNLGNYSLRWLYDVYLTLLFFHIDHHSCGADPLLQKTLKNQKDGIYDKDQEVIEWWQYRDGQGNLQDIERSLLQGGLLRARAPWPP